MHMEASRVILKSDIWSVSPYTCLRPATLTPHIHVWSVSPYCLQMLGLGSGPEEYRLSRELEQMLHWELQRVSHT